MHQFWYPSQNDFAHFHQWRKQQKHTRYRCCCYTNRSKRFKIHFEEILVILFWHIEYGAQSTHSRATKNSSINFTWCSSSALTLSLVFSTSVAVVVVFLFFLSLYQYSLKSFCVTFYSIFMMLSCNVSTSGCGRLHNVTYVIHIIGH